MPARLKRAAPPRLESFLQRSAARHPRRTALVEPGGASVTYAALLASARQAAGVLRQAGLGAGDRAAICMPKTIGSVASVFGVLLARAAYVPVDPRWPIGRASAVLRDCRPKALIVEERQAAAYAALLDLLELPCRLIVHAHGQFMLLPNGPPERDENRAVSHDDLAYILYTSGSTGEPKGVMLTHRNAVSFIGWCASVFAPAPEDTFSSHAPLHFDLSILDLFLAIRHGARIVLFDAPHAADPRLLAAEIAKRGISVWYSTPTVLNALLRHGRVRRRALGSLRLVLFAGEPFAVDALEELRALAPQARFFNLYGPTETNVCTAFEVPADTTEFRTAGLPIGSPCAHVACRIADSGGRSARRGATGEIQVRGDGVMPGYWGRPAATRRAFARDASGRAWYRTGDLGFVDEAGRIRFAGRRDRMVKRRGYRIELGEIEQCLRRHGDVGQAATVAVPADRSVRIAAFYTSRSGGPLSPLRLREYLGGALPLYMMPDEFIGLPSLPQTSTHKTDYRRLAGMIP